MPNETIELPREQFLKHLLPLLLEGGVEWQCADEIKDDLSYTEMADPSHVTSIEVKDNRLLVFSEFKRTVSEKVRRSTRWEPAEYKNHDVTVHVIYELEWPSDDYDLPEGRVLVEQSEYPTQPPAPNI